MQGNKDAGKEGCRERRMQGKKDVGKEGCMEGGSQDLRDTGKEGSGKERYGVGEMILYSRQEG